MQFRILTLLILLFTLTAAPAQKALAFAQQDELKQKLNIYPNPANNKASVRFELENPSEVVVEFFDLSGKKVKVIKKEINEAGKQKLDFEVNELNEGVYLCKIITAEWVKAERFLIRR
ncbi:T9SS type A sorting domain-containing protein [Roseimarinus sediminis]|uniref:T9SS type A sorting domain-containing protein n=1 Tax=Roseimarinus sediminis TaxID=1610899 RepID=UPI003D2469F9